MSAGTSRPSGRTLGVGTYGGTIRDQSRTVCLMPESSSWYAGVVWETVLRKCSISRASCIRKQSRTISSKKRAAIARLLALQRECFVELVERGQGETCPNCKSPLIQLMFFWRCRGCSYRKPRRRSARGHESSNRPEA